MNNVLIACSKEEFQRLYESVMTCLPTAGLQIATENAVPIRIFDFYSQALYSTSSENFYYWKDLKTLNDFQKLLGDIN